MKKIYSLNFGPCPIAILVTLDASSCFAKMQIQFHQLEAIELLVKYHLSRKRIKILYLLTASSEQRFNVSKGVVIP